MLRKDILPCSEIEMPGHALAALSAYPELACTKGPFEPATKWGVFDDVFCPKDETFTFLENVLDEVMNFSFTIHPYRR
jgi:hexosaminidase